MENPPATQNVAYEVRYVLEKESFAGSLEHEERILIYPHEYFSACGLIERKGGLLPVPEYLGRLAYKDYLMDGHLIRITSDSKILGGWGSTISVFVQDRERGDDMRTLAARLKLPFPRDI